MRAAAIGRRFVGVGTYSVGTSKYPWAGCEFYTRNSNFDSYITSYVGRQVGQVVFTRFDWEARAAAGSFSYVASLNFNNSGTASPNKTITNGHFDITF